MKTLITVLLVLFSQTYSRPAFARGPASLPGQTLALQPEQLKFRYESFDGGVSLACAHFLEDALSQDWAVKCPDPEGRDRIYRVHLWVTTYRRSVEPRASHEVLYWITDRTRLPTITGTGTTVWFHMREDAPLSGIDVGQSVENDTAGLYLNIRL